MGARRRIAKLLAAARVHRPRRISEKLMAGAS
jgi:hypothetical protein